MQTHKDSLLSLASRLGYSEETLLDVIKNAPKYYSPFHMVSIKKDGSKKTRHIDNPNKKYPLRALQKAINKELLIPEIAHLNSVLVGGIKKRSMLKHIEPHIGKKTIVCMDLSNCFPNISYERVVAVWKSLGYTAQLAKLLASATTFRGYLPQGAPTSSLLCNFAMNPMATEIEELMTINSLNFTQYIDDLCFSGNNDQVARDMINEIYKIVPRFEQRVNRKKSDIMDAKHRQALMRIVVNKQTKIDATMIKKVEERINTIVSKDKGIIDSFTNMSVGGQILHIKKYDIKAGSHLERQFNDHVKKVYDGGSKTKSETIETCWDYIKDKTHRAKCKHLTG